MTQRDLLSEAIDALKSDQAERAVGLLTEALSTHFPPAIQARATSLRAQAYFLTGNLSEAMVDWRTAWALVRDLKDPEGETALRGLRSQIAQAKAQRSAEHAQKTQSRALLETPETSPVSESSDDRLNRLLERANAHFDCDESTEGIAMAQQVLALADDEEDSVRFQVLGRLCLLRGQPQRAEELLEHGRRIADEANEAQLLGAVARAAKAVGYEFAPHVF